MIIIIGSAIFVITTYFADDIENAVIAKIQANLTTPLTLDDVAFTIYDNFPSTSVKFNNLLILESVDFGNDTLLYLSLIHISEPTRRTPILYAVFCLKKMFHE